MLMDLGMKSTSNCGYMHYMGLDAIRIWVLLDCDMRLF